MFVTCSAGVPQANLGLDIFVLFWPGLCWLGIRCAGIAMYRLRSTSETRALATPASWDANGQ